MDIEPSLWQAAVDALDAFNRDDPRRWTDTAGSDVPYEVGYADRMTHWVQRLAPDAPPAVLLAARAMHIGRWLVPRDSYPAGLNGYLQWREDLKDQHAQRTRGILETCAIPAPLIARTERLVQKLDFPHDPDSQLLEDAVCLVFLSGQLEAFTEKHAEDKVIDILRKTWMKMSDQGRQQARALPLSDQAGALLQAAEQDHP